MNFTETLKQMFYFICGLTIFLVIFMLVIFLVLCEFL